MKVSYVLALLLCASFSAQAEIYKYVDDKGQVHYSNIPVKGAKKVDLPPLTVVPLAPEPAPAAAKEGGAKADQTSRRQTLETQLAEEEKKTGRCQGCPKVRKRNARCIQNQGDGRGRQAP